MRRKAEMAEILKKLAESDQSESRHRDGQDFIVLKSTVYADDPCPCGSGKMFRDCHLPEVENGSVA